MKKILTLLGCSLLSVILYAQSSSVPFNPPQGGGGSTSYIQPAATVGGGGGTNTVGSITETDLGAGVPVIFSISDGTNINHRTLVAGTGVLITSNATTVTFTFDGSATQNGSGLTNILAHNVKDGLVAVTATNNLSVNRALGNTFAVTLTNNIVLQLAANAPVGDKTTYYFKASNLTNAVQFASGFSISTNAVWATLLSGGNNLIIATNTMTAVHTSKVGASVSIIDAISPGYTNSF